MQRSPSPTRPKGKRLVRNFSGRIKVRTAKRTDLHLRFPAKLPFSQIRVSGRLDGGAEGSTATAPLRQSTITCWDAAMSRSERRTRDDESEPDSLGGWQPVGEAVFWGAVFLGLTLAAFSLSDGTPAKTAEVPSVTNEALKPDDPPTNSGDAWNDPIALAEGERASDTKRVDMLGKTRRVQDDPVETPRPASAVVKTEPKKQATPVSSTATAPLVAAKESDLPATRLKPSQYLKKVVAVAPPSRLNLDGMYKRATIESPPTKLDVATLQKRVTLEPPSERLDVAAMQRHVVLSPATSRVDVDAMMRVAELAPATQRLDWQAMLRRAEFSPATLRTDFASMYRAATLAPTTLRLPWQAMLRTAEFAPATTRLDYRAMLKEPTFEPDYSRVDAQALSRMVKFIPLPTAYREPPPLAPALQSAAAPVKQSVPLTPPPKPAPVALELRTVPPLRKVGEALLVIARVVGSNKEPLPEQMVEWTIDRQGAGRLLALPSDAKVGPIGEKPLPTFARTYTAAAPHRVDSAWGGVQIQPGETWCVVESPSAGAMHLAARAPAVSSPSAATASAIVQWDHAQALFPENLVVQAGTETTVAAKVVHAGHGSAAPLPDYRVRYTLTDAGGATLANGRNSMEVESLTDGSAPLVVRQSSIGPAVTKGKVELLGRAPLAGHQAPVLAEGAFQVTWTPPDVGLSVNGPTAAPVEEWTNLAVAVSAKQPALAQGLRLVAIPPADVEIQSSDRIGAAYDLGPWPTSDGRPLEIAVRHDRPAARTVKFELRQGRHVWGAAEHAIRFVAPDLTLAQKTPSGWRLGQQGTASVTLHNRGLAAAHAVRVRCEVPDRFRIVDPKQGRMESNTLAWTLDRVEAGAKQTLDFTVVAKAEGSTTFKATASGRHFLEAVESVAEATVVGRPSLAVAIRDSADPVTVNGELEYTIAIENQGSAPARDVAVEVVQTAGIELLESKGTLGGEARGGRYEPPLVKEIPPNGKLVQTIRVKAAEKGDARLVVRLKHPSLQNGQVEEHESTVVYVP
jgi:hypothetical protein